MSSLRQKYEALRSTLPECQVRDRLYIKRRLDSLWPPRNPESVERQLKALHERSGRSLKISHELRKRMPEVSYPAVLPITEHATEIIEAIQKHPVVVIAGETGSGKTTQIPKMCLEAGFGIGGRIVATQPRRVAAMSVSRRIAEELKVPWGREVGCKIRFMDKTSPETIIKMVTDGMLLSEIQNDPDFSEYEVVIIDEAHERSLNIDFLLGILKQVQTRRPDLKVIITSATIDTEKFSKGFNDAPVIEVSGRLFPVEVIYQPLDEILEDEGDFTIIEGACRVVEELIEQNRRGDILVFMPTERDIRETIDLLSGRTLGRSVVFPLFGRLSSGEQQRIFTPTQKRKIIVATNIAETSLTIPGIRYVVDTGLARVSRYSAHSRTQRLPIETISRSAAKQRKGRCGRVEDGVCIRLYAEADLKSRPRFIQPEILRSNLADVILRMIAFRIGDIHTFPFLDPPVERAVQAGFQLLQDLGALDENNGLTTLGGQLASLPVDPTVGRMLLHARKKHCLAEVLIIAAGLSIQDPRERPLDKQGEADTMHRQFKHETSDFMTLLNIWKGYHDETHRLSQGQLRKFCRKHFVSYIRMREWRDIHSQLVEAMKDLGQYRLSNLEPDYDAIHRSILTGLLGNVARKEEGNIYHGTRSRKVMLFPGSTLFDRKAEKAGRGDRKARATTRSKNEKGRSPTWVMAAEWVETNRLYARTVSRIDPAWILELGEHLCQSSYTEPNWNTRSQRVLVRQRIRIYGLEVAVKRVGYGNINPVDATEIFIRSAIIGDDIKDHFNFLENNRKIREEIEVWQTRHRQTSVWDLDERIYRFYDTRIKNVSSVAELHKYMKSHGVNDPGFLHLKKENLLVPESFSDNPAAFPTRVQLNEHRIDLDYTYKPGEEDDGATLKVPFEAFEDIPPGILDWVVPGYIEERINCLLRALPKEIRKQLFPIGDKARELMLLIEPSSEAMTEVLGPLIYKEYGVRIAPGNWNPGSIPEHLKPRIAVLDRKNRTLAVDRDWSRVSETFKKKARYDIKAGKGSDRLHIWKEKARQFEIEGLRQWSFPDPPEELEIGEMAGIPIVGYPGLKAVEDGTVSLSLFKSATEARTSSRNGFLLLCEEEVGKDLAWLKKDLRNLGGLEILFATIGQAPDLREQVWNNLRNWLFLKDPFWPLQRSLFENRCEEAREKLKGLVPRMVDLLQLILSFRQDILMVKSGYPGMQEELAALLPTDFISRIPYTQLKEIPRYLNAMLVRAERAKLNPGKDARKVTLVKPLYNNLNDLYKTCYRHPELRNEIEEFRWMIEELKVSVFAQELGTAIRISPKKLKEKEASIRRKALDLHGQINP